MINSFLNDWKYKTFDLFVKTIGGYLRIYKFSQHEKIKITSDQNTLGYYIRNS